MDEIKDYIKELEALDKDVGSIPIEDDVELAILCKDPIQKLVELMNCKDELIELQAAKNLLPYFYLKKSESEAPKKLGVKEMKEARAIEVSSEGLYASVDEIYPNVYEHDKE